MPRRRPRTTPQKITLLLVDDQPSVLLGLRMRLSLEPDLAIIGEAEDGATAVSLAQQLKPAVVLLDVEMQGMDGLSAATILHQSLPTSAIVVLTLHDDEGTRAQALAAGVAGFVSKQGGDDALLAAIRAAAQR